MPSNVVHTKRDEEKWEKAKGIAEEAGHKEDYAYIMGIYKKMKPSHDFTKAAAGKYDHINFVPPESVANAAAKGLEYRQKASPSNKGGLTPSQAAQEGIGSGVQRAVNLKNRTKMSPEVISKMVGFFARHEKNKGVKPENKGTPWNDKGHVAWLLWGGDPGKAWSAKVKKQMETADKNKSASHGADRSAAMRLLTVLLARLRAAQQSHWTMHWQAHGDSSYGDHQLFERLYEALGEEIDTLAEKIVAMYGEEAVHLPEQMAWQAQIAEEWSHHEDMFHRAYHIERYLQDHFKKTYDTLKHLNVLSLGMDDFLMATANAHETNLYLLGQRLTSKQMVAKVATAYLRRKVAEEFHPCQHGGPCQCGGTCGCPARVKLAADMRKLLAQVFEGVRPHVKHWRKFLLDMESALTYWAGSRVLPFTSELKNLDIDVDYHVVHEIVRPSRSWEDPDDVYEIEADLPTGFDFHIALTVELRHLARTLAKAMRSNIVNSEGFDKAISDVINNANAMNMVGKILLAAVRHYIKDVTHGEFLTEFDVWDEIESELQDSYANEPVTGPDSFWEQVHEGKLDFKKVFYKLTGRGIEIHIVGKSVMDIDLETAFEYIEPDPY